MLLNTKRFAKLFWFICLILKSLVACLPKRVQSKEESLLQPHMIPRSGPWFEGWYIRITPMSEDLPSIGAVVGSYLPPGLSSKESTGQNLLGYAAILNGGTKDKSLKSSEVFPPKVNMFLNQNDPVAIDPKPGGSTGFRWIAEQAGEMNDKGVHLNFPNGDELKVDWSGVTHWNSSGLGPEGPLSMVKIFPLHWFVHSLRSTANFTMQTLDDNGSKKKIQGQGFVHIEKNWGRSFPDSYVWLQGINLETQSVLALAGGRLFEQGLINPEGWLIGYRSPRFKIDFRTQDVGTVIENHVDGCKGSFQLSASNLTHRIRISAQANPKSFGYIAIPKEQGFLSKGSMQSYQTKIETEIFQVKNPLNGSSKLIEKSSIENAALEFGGKFKC